MREIPALYDVARRICHDLGMDYTDPRTGKTQKAPKEKVKAAQKALASPIDAAAFDHAPEKPKANGLTLPPNMTAKQFVKSRFPKAISDVWSTSETYVFLNDEAGRCIGQGHTPILAWVNAAKRILKSDARKAAKQWPRPE